MRGHFSYIFCWVVLLPLHLVIAQRSDASLWGTHNNEVCKLYWETYSWPSSLSGFVIQKRTAKDTIWKQLNNVPIYPQIAPRDWSNLGLNTLESQTFSKTYESYLEEGKLSPNSKAHLLKALIQYNGLQAGDRINMKNDYNIALILGFAYVDHTYKKSERTSYGLFYVDNEGKIANSPVAVFKPERNPKLTLDKKFELNQGQLSILWSIPQTHYTQNGIYGFTISRKENGSNEETKIFEAPLYYHKAENGNIYWQLLDHGANPTLDYIYKLTPVTIFQTQLKPIEIKYKASQYKPVKVPAIDSLTLVNGAEFRIKWKPDSLLPFKKRIKCIFIERSAEDPAIFTQIATGISLKTNSFTDSSLLKYQQNYSYRLCIIDTKGALWKGKSHRMPFLGTRLPTKVDSLKVSFKMVLNKPYVFLTWTKSRYSTGYVLSSDEKGNGKLFENLSMPLIENNELLHEITGDGGMYQFSITPVNANGMRGESSTVSIAIPTLRLPPFPEFNATLNKNNLVEFNWEYPTDIQLKGFNIIADGHTLLSIKDVTASNRKYTLPLYDSSQANKVIVYQFEAIGIAGTKKSPIAPVHIPHYKTGKPLQLKATLKKENGKYYAVLTWLPPTSTTETATMYRIFADADAPNEFIQINNDKPHKEQTYTFLLPDPDRATYSFKIASETATGHIGPVATVTLSLKDLKK